MNQPSGNSVNFYEGYLKRVKQDKTPSKASKALTLVLPLAVLLLALAVVAGKILIDNAKKSVLINELDSCIAQLSEVSMDKEELLAERDAMQSAYNGLQASRIMAGMYHVPTRDQFTQVRASAKDVFRISQYDFNEQTGVISIDASAPSVNEVPDFVQRLRDTGLFSRVHYTGYTSDKTLEYYCTVYCLLRTQQSVESESAMEILPEEPDMTGEDSIVTTNETAETPAADGAAAN